MVADTRPLPSAAPAAPDAHDAHDAHADIGHRRTRLTATGMRTGRVDSKRPRVSGC